MNTTKIKKLIDPSLSDFTSGENIIKFLNKK